MCYLAKRNQEVRQILCHKPSVVLLEENGPNSVKQIRSIFCVNNLKNQEEKKSFHFINFSEKVEMF